MSQTALFDFYNEEDENDLKQKISNYENSVIWGTDWTTETIVSQLKRGNIDLNPKFQRRNAWSQLNKSRFIESLILGLPIPQIILAENKEAKGSYIVIDGKQRLLTIRSFFADELNDEFTNFKLKGLNILTQLNGKTFNDIQNGSVNFTILNQLLNQSIRTTVIKNWPNEDFLFTVFLRLNTGSAKLSPQELRQALHPGYFIDFADDFSCNSESIKKMLGLDDPDIRMRDVEIIIRYFCFKLFIEDYDGNLKNSFDGTVLKLNRDWDTLENKILEEANELNNAIEFTIELFGEKEAFSKWNGKAFQRNFNRAIFDIMVYYFSQSKIREAVNGREELIINGFKQLCEEDNEFLISFEHTTKSIQNTEKRFNTWGNKLKQILIDSDFKVPTLKNNKIKLLK